MNESYLSAPATTKGCYFVSAIEFKAGGEACNDTEEIHGKESPEEPAIDIFTRAEPSVSHEYN